MSYEGKPDLIAFIRARLAEDKAAALEGAKYEGKDWKAGGQRPGEDEVAIFDDDSASLVAHYVLPGTAAHIVRWNPRRVLREIEAKERMLAELTRWPFDYRADCNDATRLFARLLGLAWSDHPDYRPEWKP